MYITEVRAQSGHLYKRASESFQTELFVLQKFFGVPMQAEVFHVVALYERGYCFKGLVTLKRKGKWKY